MLDDMDEWRSVPWAAAYEVSRTGRVRKRINATHPERRQVTPIKTYPDKDGYLYTHLNRRKWLIHRLVYAVFVGPLISGLVVCHLDGEKTNNHVDNLLQTTQRENISHKVAHGTHQIGERHGRASVTTATAAAVHAALASAPRSKSGRLKRGSAPEIAKALGVSASLVREISGGKVWRHAKC